MIAAFCTNECKFFFFLVTHSWQKVQEGPVILQRWFFLCSIWFFHHCHQRWSFWSALPSIYNRWSVWCHFVHILWLFWFRGILHQQMSLIKVVNCCSSCSSFRNGVNGIIFIFCAPHSQEISVSSFPKLLHCYGGYARASVPYTYYDSDKHSCLKTSLSL